MGRYINTERIGVNAVEQIVLDELCWIFREQPIVDMGIDAHIELVDNGNPTGKLIALQIKTGASHFRETKDSFIYNGKLVHLDYWSDHSLPVVLIAHLPEAGQTLWAVVKEADVTRTGKGWNIPIPKTNVFGHKTRDSLLTLFLGSPSQHRLRKLSIDEPLMRHIVSGGKVSVELEDWVNKSLGRTPVKVFIHDVDGNETLSQNWVQYYTGFEIKELAETLFPWASVAVDAEFYEEQMDEEVHWHDEMSYAIADDNGLICGPCKAGEVYPYGDAAGEVDYYRLELRLNELGNSFLRVSDYLAGGNNE